MKSTTNKEIPSPYTTITFKWDPRGSVTERVEDDRFSINFRVKKILLKDLLRPKNEKPGET